MCIWKGWKSEFFDWKFWNVEVRDSSSSKRDAVWATSRCLEAGLDRSDFSNLQFCRRTGPWWLALCPLCQWCECKREQSSRDTANPAVQSPPCYVWITSVKFHGAWIVKYVHFSRLCFLVKFSPSFALFPSPLYRRTSSCVLRPRYIGVLI